MQSISKFNQTYMSHLFTHIVARMCLGFDLYSHIPQISIGLSNLHYLWMNIWPLSRFCVFLLNSLLNLEKMNLLLLVICG